MKGLRVKMELEIRIPTEFLKIKTTQKIHVTELANILFIQKEHIFNTDSKVCHLYRIENNIHDLYSIALDLNDLKFLLKDHKRHFKDFIPLIVSYNTHAINISRVWIKGYENTSIELDMSMPPPPNVYKVFKDESLRKLKPMSKDFLNIRDFKDRIIPSVLIKDNTLKLRLGNYVLLEKEFRREHENATREFGIIPKSFCLLFENKDFEFHYELDKIICKQGNHLFASVPYFL